MKRPKFTTVCHLLPNVSKYYKPKIQDLKPEVEGSKLKAELK